MTWVRRDDQASIHRKVAPLDDATYRLWSEAIEWCSRNTTDGRIAAEDLPTIRNGTPARAAKLVSRVLWHEAGFECSSAKCPPSGEDGWVIHDYLEYQPTKEKVRAELAAKAERTRLWRERKAGGKKPPGDTTGDASHPPSQDVSPNGHEQHTYPASVLSPSPPRPAPKEGGGGAPQRWPAADGDGAAAGREAEDQRPPTSPHVEFGLEDPQAIAADAARLHDLAEDRRRATADAQDRAHRGAAAARAAITKGTP